MSGGLKIPVDLGDRAYDINIGSGLIDTAGDHLRPLISSNDIVIVTDSNVAKTRHVQRLEQSLAGVGFKTRRFTVPAGEASKSAVSFHKLCDDILLDGIDRKTTILALGGGVVGDLAGFAAAAMLRGLAFIQVPTSLLAMVDSSVGGKTGINSPTGKNLIGAFHQPQAVIIDTDTLEDLPKRELRCGYAELVKHAFIRDPDLFEWLDPKVGQLIDQRDPALLAEAIRRSVSIKALIVAEDERETSGTRALLNFGHTFGHAYEAIGGYDGRLLHGEAVALGMVRAFTLSMKLDQNNGESLERAVDHLMRAGLPTDPTANPAGPFDPDEMLARMGKDKKTEAGALNLVLAKGIGGAWLAKNVDPADVRQVL